MEKLYKVSKNKTQSWLWLRQSRIHLQCGRSRFHLWVRKISWRRAWQPTPVFLPGESRGQRSLVGYIYGVTKSWTRLSTQKGEDQELWEQSHSNGRVLKTIFFVVFGDFILFFVFLSSYLTLLNYASPTMAPKCWVNLLCKLTQVFIINLG